MPVKQLLEALTWVELTYIYCYLVTTRWVKAFTLGLSLCSLPTNITSFIFAQEPIRLRYKLTFNQGGQPFSEVGEVKDFPDLAVLGAA